MAASPDSPTEKLAEKLAFVEHDVEQLDQVVRALHDKLDAVRAEVARMKDDTTRRLDSLRRVVEAGDAAEDSELS